MSFRESTSKRFSVLGRLRARSLSRKANCRALKHSDGCDDSRVRWEASASASFQLVASPKNRNDDHRMSSYAGQNADPIKEKLNLDDDVEIN